jgi:sugar phosphate isomerase/epimerase
MNAFAARTCLGLTVLAASAFAAPPNPFFAMDTIARGPAAEVGPLLRELGYAGLGGKALDSAMPPALAAQGLKFFNGYHTITIGPATKVTPEMRAWFKTLCGHDAALWLAIKSVTRADGSVFPNSARDADDQVLAYLRAVADAAKPEGVRIALYPHTAQWLERFEDAIRVADRLNRADVGVTFNLCHWLKVEGSERNPMPLLRSALPRLMFVSINGVDAGDTRAMKWDLLIQPLDAGTYDVRGFVRQLQKLPYTGPVGFQGYGIKGDPRAVLERTMAAWRSFD